VSAEFLVKVYGFLKERYCRQEAAIALGHVGKNPLPLSWLSHEALRWTLPT